MKNGFTYKKWIVYFNNGRDKTKKIFFKELISPFLKYKMEEIKKNKGASSRVQNLDKQYNYDSRRVCRRKLREPRHYQSEVQGFWDNKPLVGLERLFIKELF